MRALLFIALLGLAGCVTVDPPPRSKTPPPAAPPAPPPLAMPAPPPPPINQVMNPKG